MLLGSIADDFTGASDLANTLAKSGFRTTQFIGVPEGRAAAMAVPPWPNGSRACSGASPAASPASVSAVSWLPAGKPLGRW